LSKGHWQTTPIWHLQKRDGVEDSILSLSCPFNRQQSWPIKDPSGIEEQLRVFIQNLFQVIYPVIDGQNAYTKGQEYDRPPL
jgi:hypothetical protein